MADLLNVIVYLPALGALLLAFLPPLEHRNLKATALAITTINFLLSLILWMAWEPSSAGFQFETNAAWIQAFGIRYHTGVDGLSFYLILLTTFLVPVTLLGSWGAVESRVREFVIAILVLESGMLGAFVALDLFLFYVFWEAMLIPMYFVIGVWGGQRRIYAAVKFFIFTMAGSLLMLVAILYVANGPSGWDFSLAAATGRSFDPSLQAWLFGAFMLAFAIKVPMFPVHTWLPDAHTEAPTAGSVLLAGVLLKLGIYGFVRFAYPMFPAAALAYAPLIGWLAVAGIIYGAVAAWVQPDMKKLVAYSSVSHLGFCVLGVAAVTVEGMTGAVYQCLAHGISTGGLFLLVGVLYERRHTRLLADYGGLARRVPVFAFFLVFTALASAGLPTLSGFPGEFMILLGTFTASSPLDGVVNVPWLGGIRLAQVLTVLAATGVILAAVYLLWMVQKVLFGPLQDPANERISDMSGREIAVMLPLAVLMIVLGLFPGLFLKGIEPSAQRLVTGVHQRAGKVYQADAGAKRLFPGPPGGLVAPPPRPVRLDPSRLKLAPGRFDALRPGDLRRAAPPNP